MQRKRFLPAFCPHGIGASGRMRSAPHFRKGEGMGRIKRASGLLMVLLLVLCAVFVPLKTDKAAKSIAETEPEETAKEQKTEGTPENKETNEAKNEGSGETMTEMARNALILAGFNMEQFDESNPRMSEQMLIESADYLDAALAEKYPGISFVLQGCVRGGLMQPYDEYILAPADDPQARFTARIHGSSGSGFSLTDSYYGVAKAADVESFFESLIAGVEPDAAVYATVEMDAGGDVTLDTPVTQAVGDDSFFAFAWILLPPGGEDFDVRFEQVRRTVETASVSGDYAVYLMEAGADVKTKADAFAFIPKNENGQGAQVYSALRRFSLQ